MKHDPRRCSKCNYPLRVDDVCGEAFCSKPDCPKYVAPHKHQTEAKPLDEVVG